MEKRWEWLDAENAGQLVKFDLLRLFVILFREGMQKRLSLSTCNVLVVGCGNLGRWHIKGLETSKQDVTLFVADHSQAAMQSLATFVEKHMERPSNVHVVGVVLSDTDLSGLPQLNLVIVATTAKDRLLLMQSLQRSISADFWLIEKVVEQTSENMRRLVALMQGQSCFVNHPRRMMPLHQKLMYDLAGKQKVQLVCRGPENIGIASNTSHFIDLLIWWAGASPTYINTDKLAQSWYQTKRPGYWDVSGTLEIAFDNAYALKFISHSDFDQFSLEVHIGDELYCEVLESENIIKYCDTTCKTASMLSQSKMTGLLLDKLIAEGRCELPELWQSVQHNILLIEALREHWRRCGAFEHDALPIT